MQLKVVALLSLAACVFLPGIRSAGTEEEWVSFLWLFSTMKFAGYSCTYDTYNLIQTASHDHVYLYCI